jgi:flagellar assembly factor FliW
MTTLIGTRFGDLTYEQQDVFTLVDGLIGFPNLNDFLLLATKESSPFRWLQSIDEPGLAFLLTDPNQYVLDYAPEIDDNEALRLGLGPETPMMLLTTAVIPKGNPSEMTLNLAGPIILNLNQRVGKQFVIEDESCPTRFKVSTGQQAAA